MFMSYVSGGEHHGGQPYPFEYFTNPQERAMIAEAGYRVAEYLRQEDIGTLVLVDRAVRNLQIPIRAAFEEVAPDETRPSIYFLNPAGFLSPDVHHEDEYYVRAIQNYAETSEVSYGRLASELAFNPRLDRQLRSQGRKDYRFDLLMGGRSQVAGRFTPQFLEAVQKDEKFNGRVLVLDACRHTGASMDGITTALRDINTLDVRTGVVNNIRNRTVDNPDFVVFDDFEIKDVCKPFGPQEGLVKGDGRSQVVSVGTRGLSYNDRLARVELHEMMRNGAALRRQFNNGCGDGRLSRFELGRRTFGGPAELQSLILDALGLSIGFIEVQSSDGAGHESFEEYPDSSWPPRDPRF